MTSSNLPTGTVTFLFSDIQGSAPLWERSPNSMKAALERHHAILHSAIQQHRGQVFQIVGDAFCAAFAVPANAIQAAIAAQQALSSEPWGETGPLRVRMGIHVGPADLQGREYRSSHTLNRVQRIMSAGHGGQILVSQAIVELARGYLPDEIWFRDLGEHSLKGLSIPEHIYQVVSPGLPADFPPLKTEDKPRHNFPRYLTPFIGRHQEVARVKELLRECPLVTLTGPGGVGKTRLAIRVGEEMYPESPDGVWLVELAPLGDPQLIPYTLASTFGIHEQRGRPVLAAVQNYLRDRNLLLLLDNCEHLIEECAQLASDLLQTCPELRILASSREALGVDGEKVYTVPSLPFPDLRHPPVFEQLSAFEAVQLFVQRAQAALPGFELAPENAASVGRVTSRLDGIPLAIELAAARVKMLPVDQIAARLDDSFRLLSGGSRTALPRHQTLRALIDWSYSLLSGQERQLLRGLSVFSGGWTLEAAETVCSDEEGRTVEAANPEADRISSFEVLDLLTLLNNKSLLAADPQPGEELRYHLLETIRQYAREKLLESGQGEILRSKHLNFFLSLAERAEPELWRKDQRLWLDRLERDFDNLRSALEWSAESAKQEDVRAGIRLAVALEHFWLVRSHALEGERILTRLISHPEARGDLRSYGYGIRLAARLKFAARVDLPAVQPLVEECLRIAEELEDRLLIAHALFSLGAVFHLKGDLARGYYEKSLSLYRQLDYLPGQASVLGRLGRLALQVGDYASSRSYYDENLEICRELGHQLGIAGTLNAKGLLDNFEGKWREAQAAHRESLAIYRKADDKSGIAYSLRSLAGIASENGEISQAQGYLTELISIAREANDAASLGWGSLMLGEIDRDQGKYDSAKVFYEEALRLFKETDLTFGTVFALTCVGIMATYAGNYARARALFEESLAATIGVKPLFRATIFTLLGLAQLADKEGKPERATALLAVLEPHRKEFDRFERVDRQLYDEILSSVKAQLDAATFASAWSQGEEMQKWEMEAAIEYARRD